MSGKVQSWIFRIIAVVGIAVCGILYFLNIMPNATINDIVILFISIYAIGAGAIDLNILVDKFVKRIGDKE